MASPDLRLYAFNLTLEFGHYVNVIQPGNRRSDTPRSVLVCILMYIPRVTTRMSSSHTETSGTEHETLSRRQRTCNVLNKTRHFTTTVLLRVSPLSSCSPWSTDWPGPGSGAGLSSQLCRTDTSPCGDRLSGSSPCSDSQLFHHFPEHVSSSHMEGVREQRELPLLGPFLKEGR